MGCHFGWYKVLKGACVSNVTQLRNEDGKLIDTTYGRDAPFTFKVGSGQVVRGTRSHCAHIRTCVHMAVCQTVQTYNTMWDHGQIMLIGVTGCVSLESCCILNCVSRFQTIAFEVHDAICRTSEFRLSWHDFSFYCDMLLEVFWDTFLLVASWIR